MAFLSPPDPRPLLALGLAVFALPPGSRRPTGPWHARCLTDPRQAKEHWRAGDNIGVSCRASGIIVLDLDGAEGIATFAELCERYRQAEPETLTVRTPHGGRHLYFRVDQAATLPSTSGGTSGLGPSIDTRGPGRRYGGYLVGPGSVVPAGRYEVSGPHPIRALPDWIERLLRRRTPTRTKARTMVEAAAELRKQMRV